MNENIVKIFCDLSDYKLPRNEKNLDKINFELKIGQKIYWYYKEDLEFFENEGEDIKENLDYIFSGIIIPIPGTDSNAELYIENCILVITDYPTEKQSPEIDWVSLNRLLDNDSLIEVFTNE